jgi:hypothetical protein
MRGTCTCFPGVCVLLHFLLISTSPCVSKCMNDNTMKCPTCRDTNAAVVFRGGSHRGTSPTTIPVIPSSARACQFYLWNAPSALLSRWCIHLQRDSVYEGRGGKKVCVVIFVVYADKLRSGSQPSCCSVRSNSTRFDASTSLSMQSIQS